MGNKILDTCISCLKRPPRVEEATFGEKPLLKESRYGLCVKVVKYSFFEVCLLSSFCVPLFGLLNNIFGLSPSLILVDFLSSRSLAVWCSECGNNLCKSVTYNITLLMSKLIISEQR
eukprot:TRINITY_DN15584_c0_g1_i1.p1 TRINITY_DN15584_c0_g1~~TRINITY_DN15584_c0_g1_i1.p1  ORF type:complete len:117 (-),score=12.87 TRINITY_DN15584_c0_g1_i1:111-461(-)